jgi:hypothetical protein
LRNNNHGAANAPESNISHFREDQIRGNLHSARGDILCALLISFQFLLFLTDVSKNNHSTCFLSNRCWRQALAFLHFSSPLSSSQQCIIIGHFHLTRIASCFCCCCNSCHAPAAPSSRYHVKANIRPINGTHRIQIVDAAVQNLPNIPLSEANRSARSRYARAISLHGFLSGATSWHPLLPFIPPQSIRCDTPGAVRDWTAPFETLLQLKVRAVQSVPVAGFGWRGRFEDRSFCQFDLSDQISGANLFVLATTPKGKGFSQPTHGRVTIAPCRRLSTSHICRSELRFLAQPAP